MLGLRILAIISLAAFITSPSLGQPNTTTSKPTVTKVCDRNYCCVTEDYGFKTIVTCVPLPKSGRAVIL